MFTTDRHQYLIILTFILLLAITGYYYLPEIKNGFQKSIRIERELR